MIRSFADAATEDINDHRRTKRALRRLPADLHELARVKLARLHAADTLLDLASLPGSRLEKLRGDRLGQHRIRINDQDRICFKWNASAAEEVEIVDYH